MNSFFPDVNIWLAGTVTDHVHAPRVWRWIEALPPGSDLIMCRYTQTGLMRLLATEAVAGSPLFTLDEAWDAYLRWRRDPRVTWRSEPPGLEEAWRKMMGVKGFAAAAKWVADAYLLAFADRLGATFVTFDRAILEFAAANGDGAIRPD